MSVVRLDSIVKQYPKVRALDDANFILEKGEIHALLGENGAGKSTLMKVLYGMVQPDSGEIWVNEKKVHLNTPLDAIDLRIGMVHQHFMLADALTAMENIIVGAELGENGLIDFEKSKKQLNEMIERFSFNLDIDKNVGDFSVGEKQRVEILKVLYRGADILILDEPTAVLTPLEVEGLFSVLNQLKSEGKSIIIITHKLYEVTEIADKITVMRDGKVTGYADPKEITLLELANLMVGREIKIGVKERTKKMGEVRFEIKNLTLTDKHLTILDDINLKIHSGEILGLAGIEGNGQSELIKAVTGLITPSNMEIFLDGKQVEGNSEVIINSGIGHVPEDRLMYGVVENMTIAENTILGYHHQEQFKTKGLYDKQKIKKYTDESIEQYKIKTPDSNVLINELSGGNQQKVVIARVFRQSPKVVICAQPTRGVDIGATEYIHSKIREYRDAGNSVLLISADLQEIQSLSDSIAVIYKGKIVSHENSDLYSDVQLGVLMTGGSIHENKEVVI